jgi:hypothetical protein
MRGTSKKWMVAAAVAGALALVGGIGYAAIPGSNGVVWACYGNNEALKIFDKEAGETCRGTELALLGANGKAADADLLDGKDSTDFVAVGQKVSDADRLDGMDSTAFFRDTPNSIRSEHIAFDTIRSEDIGFDAVGSDEIANNSIWSEHIAFNTIRSEDIGFDAVRSDEIANNSITTAKFSLDAKAPDADKLDGKNSSDFYAAGAKVTDSDELDGRDSIDFYSAGEKVADSERLDGLDATALLRSSLYVTQVTVSGTGGANAFSSASVSCRTGDAILSAGFYGVDLGTHLFESSPAGFSSWRFQWHNDSTVDELILYAWCADQ